MGQAGELFWASGTWRKREAATMQCESKPCQFPCREARGRATAAWDGSSVIGSGVAGAGEKDKGQRSKAYCLPLCISITAVSLTLHFNSEGLTQSMDCALM